MRDPSSDSDCSGTPLAFLGIGTHGRMTGSHSEKFQQCVPCPLLLPSVFLLTSNESPQLRTLWRSLKVYFWVWVNLKSVMNICYSINKLTINIYILHLAWYPLLVLPHPSNARKWNFPPCLFWFNWYSLNAYSLRPWARYFCLYSFNALKLSGFQNWLLIFQVLAVGDFCVIELSTAFLTGWWLLSLVC